MTIQDETQPGSAAPFGAPVSKVVLAYSGGLDHVDHPALAAGDLRLHGGDVHRRHRPGGRTGAGPGQGPGHGRRARRDLIEDLREEFARDFVFPMFRANAVYEGEYLLGTSIARPLIAKRLVEIAAETGADAISHGATGKGNDQVRFELGAYALAPDIRVIAPWREWDLGSRESLMAYAADHGIPVERVRGAESPFSMDANLLHISYEGGPLEDPWKEPPAEMWRWSVSPQLAPDEPTYVDLTFAAGDIVAVDGRPMTPGQVLSTLNAVGGANGVGRIDIVENRYVGHEEPGRLRDPRRHDHAAGPSGHRVAHPRPGRGPPQGRADAPLRRADLQTATGGVPSGRCCRPPSTTARAG